MSIWLALITHICLQNAATQVSQQETRCSFNDIAIDGPSLLTKTIDQCLTSPVFKATSAPQLVIVSKWLVIGDLFYKPLFFFLAMNRLQEV